MKTYHVDFTQMVNVSVDETKFTEEWMAEFRQSFYPLHTVEEHVQHLAQLHGRGLVDNWTSFIEGYGAPADFGMKFSIEDSEIEILAETAA